MGCLFDIGAPYNHAVLSRTVNRRAHLYVRLKIHSVIALHLSRLEPDSAFWVAELWLSFETRGLTSADALCHD